MLEKLYQKCIFLVYCLQTKHKTSLLLNGLFGMILFLIPTQQVWQRCLALATGKN